MDESIEYRLLCERATEVQALKPNLSGFNVWLPDRMQLQAIIANRSTNFAAFEFNDPFVPDDVFVESTKNLEEDDPYSKFRDMIDSWEKYWLMVVMNRIFHKQWNNETKQWEVIK